MQWNATATVDRGKAWVVVGMASNLVAPGRRCGSTPVTTCGRELDTDTSDALACDNSEKGDDGTPVAHGPLCPLSDTRSMRHRLVRRPDMRRQQHDQLSPPLGLLAEAEEIAQAGMRDRPGSPWS